MEDKQDSLGKNTESILIFGIYTVDSDVLEHFCRVVFGVYQLLVTKHYN